MNQDILKIPIERIENAIYLIRGEKVMLDSDLAELYQVQTKALNQAVRRNLDRFPPDFMFQLTEKEVSELNRSQFVTGFTEASRSKLSTVCLYGTGRCDVVQRVAQQTRNRR